MQDARFHRAVVLDSKTLCAAGLMAHGARLLTGAPTINVPLSSAYYPRYSATSVVPEDQIIDLEGEDRIHTLWAADDWWFDRLNHACTLRVDCTPKKPCGKPCASRAGDDCLQRLGAKIAETLRAIRDCKCPQVLQCGWSAQACFRWCGNKRLGVALADERMRP